MAELVPSDLNNMQDVALYWRQCLNELDQGIHDQDVASHIVGVVSNDNDESWSESATSHPAYPIIFELAGSLELPEDFTAKRRQKWDCIRALVSVLEREYVKKSE